MLENYKFEVRTLIKTIAGTPQTIHLLRSRGQRKNLPR